MRYPQALFFFSILLFAAGCSSSDSSSNNDEPDPMGDDTPKTLSLNGNAADGYLRGATVCLDTDGDRACAGEATSTTTGESGVFTLNASAEAFQRFPIVTEVVEGTLDEDTITDKNPQGTPITKDETYTLTAPPSSVAVSDEDGDGTIEARVFVSPITTIVEQTRQQIAADDPDATITETLEQARTEIAASLGAETNDLILDYVAVQDAEDSNEASVASALKLHNTAQTIAIAINRIGTGVDTALDTGEIADGQTAIGQQIYLELLINRLVTISNGIQEAIETNPDTIAEAVKTIANANDVVQPGALGDLIDTASAETTAVTAADVIQRDGGVWVVGIDRYFDYDFEEAAQTDVWAENFGFTPADGDTAAISKDDCYQVDVETGELKADKDEAFSAIVLTEDGWTNVETPAGDNCLLEFALAEGGSVTGTSPDGESFTLDAPVQQLELQDLSIVSLLTLHDTVSDVAWPYIFKDEATFSSAEATGFVITGTDTEPERYSLGSSEAAENSSSVVGYRLGHNTYEPEIDSLDDIVHEAGTELFDADGILDDSVAFIDVGQSAAISPSTQLSLFLADSKATYFSRTYDPETNEVETEVLGTTPFTLNTVNGARLLVVPTIDEVAEFTLYYSVENADSDRPFVFTEYQDAVRFVSFAPKEVETFSVLALNKEAKDELVGAFNADHFDIRAALPVNLASIASLIPEGASFPSSNDPVFYTKRWGSAGIGEPNGAVWSIGEAITDPNDGTGTRTQPHPEGYFENRLIVQTLALTDGLYAQAVNSGVRVFSPESEVDISDYVSKEVSLVSITEISGEGDSVIFATCTRRAFAFRAGDIYCAEPNVDSSASFASLSKDLIEAKAIELTANNQTISIDQTQFVGNRLYTFEFYTAEDGASELERLEITLNDDEAKSVTVHEQGITNVNLSYEFNDYGLQISGTLVADGETEELSEFLLLREYHEADEVYSACWKNAENSVTSVAEAVNACALDYGEDRTRSVITLSETRANAIEEAGSFAPSSSAQ